MEEQSLINSDLTKTKTEKSESAKTWALSPDSSDSIDINEEKKKGYVPTE